MDFAKKMSHRVEMQMNGANYEETKITASRRTRWYNFAPVCNEF
jgi:hypothetical protein